MGSESPAPSPTAPYHPVLKLPLWGMRIHLPDLKARPGLTSPFRHAHLDSTSNQEPGRKRGTALPSPRMRTSRGGHHFAARGAVRRRRQVSAVPGCPQARPRLRRARPAARSLQSASGHRLPFTAGLFPAPCFYPARRPACRTGPVGLSLLQPLFGPRPSAAVLPCLRWACPGAGRDYRPRGGESVGPLT